MKKLLILTYANKEDPFLDEWIESMIINNLKYKILGMGSKWEGFISKTKYFMNELNNIMNNITKEEQEDLIIILCDSYDLFFQENEEFILDKYFKLSNYNKIIIGSESYCKGNCYLNQNKCDITVNKYPYINSGFIIGPVNMLYDAYQQIKTFTSTTDDQIAWGMYRAFNCDKVLLDYNSDLVLNMAFEDMNDYTLIFHDGKIFNKTKNNFPCAIHMAGQHRTYPNGEIIRNYLFPGRKILGEEHYLSKYRKKYKLDK